MQINLDKVNNFKMSIENAKSIFDTQPVLSTSVINDLNANFNNTTASIIGYTYGEGSFSISCRAKNNDDPSNVIANLAEQDIFDHVTYL